MKTKKTINIVEDFSKSPYGRYTSELQPGEEDTTGQRFRNEYLLPALREFHEVHIVLTGYNRYGPSFIDEAFGELIAQDGFSLKELQERMTFEHSELPSIISLIQSRMRDAEERRTGKKSLQV